MPRHEAPNNPNCFIDCEGAGGAYFREPDGPCHTFCSDGDSKSLARMLERDVKFGATISLRIVGMSARWIVQALRPLMDKETIQQVQSLRQVPPITLSGNAQVLVRNNAVSESLQGRGEGEADNSFE